MRKGIEYQLWLRAAANKIGCLDNGRGDFKNENKTMSFIPYYDKPYNRKATYLRIVAEDKPHKKKGNVFASMLVVIVLIIKKI